MQFFVRATVAAVMAKTDTVNFAYVRLVCRECMRVRPLTLRIGRKYSFYAPPLTDQRHHQQQQTNPTATATTTDQIKTAGADILAN